MNATNWSILSGAHIDTYQDGIATIRGRTDNDDGRWRSPFEDVSLEEKGEAARRFGMEIAEQSGRRCGA